MRALRESLRRREWNEEHPLHTLGFATTGPTPVRQSLRLQGLMGGSLALRVDRGAWRLPDLAALRTGDRGTYGQALGSQRLELSADALQLGSGTKLGAQWLRFNGGSGAGERLALSLSSGRLQVGARMQQLDQQLRPGRDITAADAALFANEVGMKRRGLDLRYRTGAKEVLSLAQTRLAASGGEAGFERLAYTGKKDLALSFESGRVDRKFDRAGTLPAAEKALFTRERGFRWQDLSARFRPARRSLLELTRYRAQSNDGPEERARDRLAWTLTPSRASRLLMVHETALQQTAPGREQETTTELYQWEQSLANGIAVRAVREQIQRDLGAQSQSQDRTLLTLRANPKSRFQWSAEQETLDAPGADTGSLKLTLARPLVRDWKLQGNYTQLSAGPAADQTSYQASLGGHLGKLWQLSGSSLQRVLSRSASGSRHSLQLAGAPGALKGALHRSRFSLELATVTGLPMALAPSSKHAAKPKKPARDPEWNSVLLLTETKLARSQLTLGMQSLELPAGHAGGATWWWRSTDKRPLQWELRRHWLELETGVLVPRERMAVSYVRGRCRLGASTELNPEPAPAKPLLGQRQSALDLQTQVGQVRLAFARGLTVDRLQATSVGFWRVTVECPLAHKGLFQSGYEINTLSSPNPALPNRRVNLTYRQEFAPDRRVDLQAELRQWSVASIPDELTWRLDLLATF